MATATLTEVEQPIWPPTTHHYAISDGTFLLVEVDEAGPTEAMEAYIDQINDVSSDGELIPSPINFVQRPTVILPANANGFATSLTVLHRFEPGTEHEAALQAAGFEVLA